MTHPWQQSLDGASGKAFQKKIHASGLPFSPFSFPGIWARCLQEQPPSRNQEGKSHTELEQQDGGIWVSADNLEALHQTLVSLNHSWGIFSSLHPHVIITATNTISSPRRTTKSSLTRCRPIPSGPTCSQSALTWSSYSFFSSILPSFHLHTCQREVDELKVFYSKDVDMLHCHISHLFRLRAISLTFRSPSATHSPFPWEYILATSAHMLPSLTPSCFLSLLSLSSDLLSLIFEGTKPQIILMFSLTVLLVPLLCVNYHICGLGSSEHPYLLTQWLAKVFFFSKRNY